MTEILLTGATGYIGGSVLTLISSRTDIKIRCLVRTQDQANKLMAVFPHITTLVGSHDDITFMTEAASQVDVVIAMADAENIVAVIATLAGLKIRYGKNGNKPTTFIQTSGTEIFSDYAAGMCSSNIIWDDVRDASKMKTLKPPLPHRLDIEKRIIDADVEGYVKTYMIFPSNVWGIATGDVFTKGISRKQSFQIPTLIRASLNRTSGPKEHAGMIGQGLNKWGNVEIHEFAQLYNLLLTAALSKTDNPDHGSEGYYFGVNDEHSMLEIGNSLSITMHDKGKGNGAAPTPFTPDEIQKLNVLSNYGVYDMGSNTRCTTTRCKKIKWAPVKKTADMLASIDAELALILTETTTKAKL